MIGLREGFVALGFLEDRQNVAPAPSVAAECKPFVVVGGRAADVDHGIDRAAAAQSAGLRNKKRPRSSALLDRRLIHDDAVGAEQPDKGPRHVNERGIAVASGFEKQYPVPGLGQPSGDHTSGGTATNNDEFVEFRRFRLRHRTKYVPAGLA